MNNYIVLDGNKYKTNAKNWTPAPQKAGSVRLNLDGTLDATYGSGTLLRWEGEIMVPVTAAAGWGTIAQLRTSLQKTSGLILRTTTTPPPRSTPCTSSSTRSAPCPRNGTGRPTRSTSRSNW